MLQVMHQAHKGGPSSRGFFFFIALTPFLSFLKLRYAILLVKK